MTQAHSVPMLEFMLNRRLFVQGKLSLPFWGLAAATPARDFVQELGLRPFINAAEPFTALSGGLLPREAAAAWEAMSAVNLRLEEVHDAVGKRIASLINAEAAMVTAGAASALTLGTAACITGTNREFIRRLPDTTGMKNEVIIQKSHRYGYDHAVRNCGTRYVEVETREELERAIGDRTAMLHFFNTNDPIGRIKAAEFAELGKKHGIPTFNDIAADVPPADNLSRFTRMGFDIVAVSGGKGMRGPQSCGLLFGRKELIAAARLNAPPNSDAIGRGQKVNKEEMVAMMVTLEVYLKRDHEADWTEWERRLKLIAERAETVSGVRTERFMPEIHYRVPHLRIRWVESQVKITPAEAARRLKEGEPSIELRPSAKDSIELSSWMLQPGEAEIVARRVRETLSHA